VEIEFGFWTSTVAERNELLRLRKVRVALEQASYSPGSDLRVGIKHRDYCDYYWDKQVRFSDKKEWRFFTQVDVNPAVD